MPRTYPHKLLLGRWTDGCCFLLVTSVRDGVPHGYRTNARGEYRGGKLERLDLTGFRRMDDK